MGDLTRETVERWLPENSWYAQAGEPGDGTRAEALARWALERDAVAQDAEWALATDPCIPFKTPLGLRLNAALAKAEETCEQYAYEKARAESAEAKLAAVEKEPLR